MKKYWKLMLMAVGMSAAFTLASCNDDKDVVIDQIYYISTDPSATTYPTTFSVSLVDNSVAGRPFFYVVGKSTMRVDRNTTLRVEEDSKLVEKYNETYGKKYLPFPEGTYSFSTNEVTINQGDNFSSDTIFISFSNWDKLSKIDKYLLPVSLKAVDDKGAVSMDRNLIYFIADFSTTNTGYNKPAAWKPLDRTDWDVSFSYAYGYDEAQFGGRLAVDGDVSTTWFTWGVVSAGECWWATTLPAPTHLTGFSLTRQTTFGSSYNVREAKVKVKKEGDTEWTEAGLFRFGSFKGNDPQYAVFIPAVENVKEFRIDIVSPAYFTGFAELDLYQ